MKAVYIAFFFCCTMGVQAQEIYSRALLLMGSRFDITVVANSPKEGDSYIDLAIEEISRIEKLISSWDASTQISELNRKAGIAAVQVDPEVIALVTRAKKISEISDGAFDISYASMDKIWRFDGSMKILPSDSQIAQSVAKINYKNIVINTEENTLFLKEKGMKIGFGGIGKGYAADSARRLLQNSGVSAGIINASGDLTSWGTQPNGNDWIVGITNPVLKNEAFSWVPLKNYAVATSGTYEKQVKIDDQVFSHIIDPRTGWPVRGIVSVSIFSTSAELSDALATTVFVMGTESGLNLVNQLKNVYCLIVDDENKIYKSTNLETHAY